uniref:NADH-ubiquinone oxidoreductase chain 2 n=1 Tax=Homotoma ficus TaxID=2218120 RepID=A0A344A2E4_9HEMI|nr:NADH dehydrogenase subunit 2 [Homotoma ficus]AWU48935.1 NADH dehydrogenase subunit 2 [Homotoma ficus]
MKINKILIMPMFFFSIIAPISSSSWMMMWMSMEINMMMFIFLILIKKNMFSTESSMKYFLIQCSGSLIFLLSLSSNLIYFYEWPLIQALVPPIALMLKSGIAPLHSWMPEIIKNINPFSFFLFLTLQKIPLLMILFSFWSKMTIWISVINIVIGSLTGIIQSSMIKMLISSSISNTGWMMLSLLKSNLLFLFQFFIYTILIFTLIKMMNTEKVKWMIQINSSNLFKKMIISMNMLSMSGMPPLLGFMPKWIIIKKMFMLTPMIVFIFILMTVMNLFFYIKSTVNMMFMFSSTKKWMNKFNLSNLIYTTFVINFTGIPVFFLFN